MALIKCPDCGAQVSDSAASCPSCARPIAGIQIQVKSVPGLSVLLKVVAIFFVLLLVFLFLIVVQAMDQLGHAPVFGQPVWVPRPGLRPLSTAVALVFSLAIVGLAIHYGRRKRK